MSAPSTSRISPWPALEPTSFRSAHPSPDDVLVLIEVCEASAASDRQLRVPLYAEAGVAEVWLVDLPAEAIEVHRRPAGHRYTDVRTFGRGEQLTPEALPELTVTVSEVLGS